MAATVWTPLDYGKRQIRLAHLAPSHSLDEQPSCTLHVVSLNDSLAYEALSYAWGDRRVTTPIRLHNASIESKTFAEGNMPSSHPPAGQTYWAGGPQPPKVDFGRFPLGPSNPDIQDLSSTTVNRIHGVSYPVTKSLEEALRYLRHESRERVLWVDAICINQSDVEERNNQVPLMKDIYSNAANVLLWLGGPTAGSDDAMAILKALGQGNPLHEIKLHNRLVDDISLQSTIELLRRPWWNRTWVQQEVLLAKKASLHCGQSSFDWGIMPDVNSFSSVVGSAMKSLRLDEYLLDDLLDSFDSFVRIKNMGEIYEDDPDPPDEDFILVLAAGRTTECSDARDLIYGFLGLMSEHIASKIKTDYSMSVAEVFEDAAIQLTACSQSLILFSLTQYAPSEGRLFPTWVPSWYCLKEADAIEEWDNRARRLVQYDYFSACGQHSLEFEIVTGNLLKLSGRRLDEIVNRGSTCAVDPSAGELLEQHREWLELCGLADQESSQYVAGGNAFDAFWQTLANDIFLGLGESRRRRRCRPEDRAAYLAWLHELETSAAAYWESKLANSFNTSSIEACMGRRFFVTRDRYFGIGPAELEHGDEIHILAGGKLPYVLRPLPGPRPRTYELVGDCYVHGIMDGEMLSDGSIGRDVSAEGDPEHLAGAEQSADGVSGFHDVFIV